MKTKTVLITVMVAFVVLCGLLVIESGLFERYAPGRTRAVIPLAGQATAGVEETNGKTVAAETESTPAGQADEGDPDYDFTRLRATHAAPATVTLGSLYPEIERTDDKNRFKFMVELTSKGAAIKTVTLSEFDDRDPDNPQPLKLITPMETGSGPKYSLANTTFLVPGQKKPFPLEMLDWQLTEDVTTESDGSQKVVFGAVLRDAARKDAFRITKTYRLAPGSYDLQYRIKVENLSDATVEVNMGLQGPGGIVREDARSDMRKVAAAYLVGETGAIELVKKDFGKLRKSIKKGTPEQLSLHHNRADAHFIWGAVINKYFTAIVRCVPDEGQWCRDVVPGPAQYTDPQLDAKSAGDAAAGSFSLHIPGLKLAAAGEEGAERTFTFHLYLGPKDRDFFNKNAEYRKLAYFKTIDFRGCCCPAKLIEVLAFGIMAIMKAMYRAMGPFGNYGVVIMILVFLVRLVMHPITKKSQVSMMRMQKLGPKMEELKKKYAKDKAELNKRVMELYREQGVSPFSSFLPMMVQMPIWIALWSAINVSIDLRGAGFLPFWITDLSSPDALFRFREFTIPLLGWHIDSFNLLPLLMGVVMYLQQKLMPHSKAAEETNPQVAQQQKMMMIMMPLLFPIMLYKGPSGVNLYIMSSISAGVIEQMVIRKHIREKEQEEARRLVPVTKKTGGKVKKKKPKPFFKT